MSKQKKSRLDLILVKRGLFPSRSQAVAAVMAGNVRVEGRRVDKPGALFDEDCPIAVEAATKYVSRGGQKLEAAFDYFKIAVDGLVVLDGGSSTGGFTDCLLKRGAGKVMAVDVGYGQLAWKLRQDERVELHERVNLRYLKPEILSEKASLAVIDVSFISVTKVVPPINECLVDKGELLILIKPQFEVGRGQVGKGGIVKDPDKHKQALHDVGRWMINFGLNIKGLYFSPILGAKGNIEFWLYLTKENISGIIDARLEGLISETVSKAHLELG